MEISRHIEAVRGEGRRFAEAGASTSLDTPIQYCPGWTMRDLLRHLSEIHLWASAHVALRATKMWVDDLTELTGYWPGLAVFWPDDADLVDHYLATNENLLKALENAPADLDAMTFLPAPSPLAMWARRQAHEIAVHRYDAEHAAGMISGFDPLFAADGIDELLCAFAPRRNSLPVTDTKRMGITTVDTADQWVVTLGPDGIETSRGGGDADVTVTGAAEDLYLMTWNRGDRDTLVIDGDRSVIDTWHGNQRVRWED